MEVVSSMVKADKNWPFRISDLVVASLWVVPSFFRGATPELSHFFSLTKEKSFLQLDLSLTNARKRSYYTPSCIFLCRTSVCFYIGTNSSCCCSAWPSEKLDVSAWIISVQLCYTMTGCIWRRSFWKAHVC